MKSIKRQLSWIMIVILLVSTILSPQLFGTTALATEAVTTSGYEKTIEATRTAIQNELSTGNLSGASIAIMVDGNIVYSEAFGLRDREKNLAVDTKTQFNIGSISKIFTAAAVLKLVEEGKLELDLPVTTYIPEFTMKDDRYKAITVRMLLNHTSGIPGTNMKNGFSTIKDRDYIEDTLESLKMSYLIHNPGEISVYCNDGFTLAESIIERVSGKSFGKYLEENFFKPLGMQHTSAYFKEGYDNLARVYELGAMEPLPLEYVNLLGSGGLSSTAEDLCRFGEILKDNTIMGKAVMNEYTKAQYGPKTAPGKEALFNSGLGWDFVGARQFEIKGIKVLAKNGGTIQYSSQFYTVPEERISLAVLFAGYGNPVAVANTVFQTLLEEKGLVEKLAENSLPQAMDIPESYKSFEGVYYSGSSIIEMKISEDLKQLILSTYDGTSYAEPQIHTYRSDGLFYGEYGNKISLVKNAEGSYIMSHPYDVSSGVVALEKLKANSTIDGSNFAGKVWVPRNMEPTELTLMVYKTDILPGSPGYIIMGNGDYFPLALKSPTESQMNFQYIRDQQDVKIEKKYGTTFLNTGLYSFTDAEDLDTMNEIGTLTIGAQGANEIMTSSVNGVYLLEIPAGARIAIFNNSLTDGYDTMMNSNRKVYIEKGSYIIAIGKVGDTFKLTKFDIFKDIKGHWAEDTVNLLASKSIVKGVDKEKYGPGLQMKGSDFISLLERVFKTDIKDEYASEESITRGQALTEIAKLLATIGYENKLSIEEANQLLKAFKDVENVDEQLKKDVAFLVQMGIVKGRGGTIALEAPMTRAEGAFLIRALMN